jgi:RNA polymerase sigma-70 factor (ECF subfamily)
MAWSGKRLGNSILSDREQLWSTYVGEICAGNAQSLAQLYDETSAPLYSLALRVVGNEADAEEVLLEVYEQVWRRASTFDRERGGVWRWMTVMTRSRALDRLRAGATRRHREQPVEEGSWEPTGTERPPDEARILEQEQALVRQALLSLPPEQRQAVELAYYSELTHTEIADKLGVPLGTIKTRIRTGMKKLRLALYPEMAEAREPAE